jgi:hypothetical protein
MLGSIRHAERTPDRSAACERLSSLSAFTRGAARRGPDAYFSGPPCLLIAPPKSFCVSPKAPRFRQIQHSYFIPLDRKLRVGRGAIPEVNFHE